MRHSCFYRARETCCDYSAAITLLSDTMLRSYYHTEILYLMQQVNSKKALGSARSRVAMARGDFAASIQRASCGLQEARKRAC
jgi:hypothetical protein